VRVALKGVSGVRSVEVSLNQGLATVILQDGNRVRLSQLREAIARNGFSVKEARLSGLGQIISSDDHLLLETAGSGERFELMLEAGAKPSREQLRGLSGQTVTLHGTIPDAGRAADPNVLYVSAVQVKGKPQ